MTDSAKAILKNLARNAMQMQDASNITGLCHSMARDIPLLREVLELGSDATANHPITILWVDKLTQLSGIQDLDNDKVFQAYTAVRKIIEE